MREWLNRWMETRLKQCQQIRAAPNGDYQKAKHQQELINDLQNEIADADIGKGVPTPDTPMQVFTITVRRLDRSSEKAISWLVAVPNHSEVDAVRAVKLKFTAEWWDSMLITDVVRLGTLHVIGGKALYDRD